MKKTFENNEFKNTWIQYVLQETDKIERSLRNRQDYLEDYDTKRTQLNLLANILAASKFILEKEGIKDMNILEIGFGELGILPLLSEYGADTVGISLDEKAVELAKQKGYQTALADITALEHGLRKLGKKNYIPDMIVSSRVYERGGLKPVGGLKEELVVASLLDRLRVPNGEEIMDAYIKGPAEESFINSFEIMKPGGIQIHTNTPWPFILEKKKLENIGYKIIAYNEEGTDSKNFSHYITIIQKPLKKK